MNVIDLRIAKILRFGRTRTNVGVDIYNLFNSSAVLTYNQAFNPVGTLARADDGRRGKVCENQRDAGFLIPEITSVDVDHDTQRHRGTEKP